MKKILEVFILFVFLQPCTLWAQPSEQIVKVIVAPDRDDWTYKAGDPVKFSISVFKSGNPLKNLLVSYKIGPERMKPTIEESKTLNSGSITVHAGTMKTAGFLRCVATVEVDGVTYKGLATAGFDPLKIEPTIAHPADFDAFWDTAKQELAKIPLDARMTLLPERCTETVDVYHVNIQNTGPGVRLYGILCQPKKEGKYPALLRVPGAGVRSYGGSISTAEKGIITFDIGIHGIPVNLPEEVYASVATGLASQYFSIQLDNRDRFYFKRVYLGCVRANDFITSLPNYDGKNLAVTGGSQGGALSIVTAALDSRVKWLAALYPALSDVTGYLHGRAGGWPHYFQGSNLALNNTKEKLHTLAYYDVVNFARRVKVPGLYSWGFNDETCPPTSIYASYNVIQAPKELYLALDTGHWQYPEQRTKFNDWLLKNLKSN